MKSGAIGSYPVQKQIFRSISQKTHQILSWRVVLGDDFVTLSNISKLNRRCGRCSGSSWCPHSERGSLCLGAQTGPSWLRLGGTAKYRNSRSRCKNMARGHAHMTSAEFSVFWTLSLPLVSTKCTQPSSFLSDFGQPPPPSHSSCHLCIAPNVDVRATK